MATMTIGAPVATPLLKILKSPKTARLLFPVVVLVVWQIASLFLDARVFPDPAKVLLFMWKEATLDTLLKYGSVKSNLYEMFALSIWRLFAGFVISVVAGTIIGLGMGLSKSIDAFFHDWVVAILAMPALVWALFMSLVFGFGSKGPILVTILTGIPFVIVNVREGVRNTPKELFDMARSFQVPRQRITRHVLLPSLMPFFFAAMRYAFSIGWKGLVIAEVFGADSGMGWTIKFWYDANRPQGVIGYALFFVIFTLALEKLVFEPLTERTFKWRPTLGAVDLVEEQFLMDETLDGAEEASSHLQGEIRG